MSQKANPAFIGLFVVIGIGLAFGAAVILSSGPWKTDTYTCVMVFEGDVSGLSPGAPVQYQGVKVGTVESIQLVVDPSRDVAQVPVVVRFDPSRFTYIGEMPPQEALQREIKDGLRAQLQLQSLVTGLQKIMLVHRPGSDGTVHDTGFDMPEIPTIPNLSQTLMQDLAALQLEDLVKHARGTLANLDRITHALVEDEVMASTRDTLDAVRSLSETLEGEVPALSKEAVATSESVRALAEGLEPLSRELVKELPVLLESVESNSKAFLELQTELNAALDELRAALDRDAPERQQLRDSLTTLSQAAARARLLFEYLERHPESILTGKSQP